MSNASSLWFPAFMAPKHPDKIQLYSMATPNGQKVAIALEELELPYEAHVVNILEGDQHEPSYLKINPNGKIPSLSDPDGPGGQILLMESGAILEYLAEKTGKLFGQSAQEKWQIKQWLYFQMGHVGPMFGQFGHFFKYAREKCDHPYPVERYTKETKRLLGVMDKQLTEFRFISGNNFSIADIALWPWVTCLDEFYKGGHVLELNTFSNVLRWLESVAERPAVQRGKSVCSV